MPVSNRADQVSRAGGDVVRVRATLGEGAAPACGNNHDKGMCCIEGRALYYARHQPGRWSWAIVVDDDVYIDVPNLLTMVAELNSTAPILYGIGGCNKGPLSCGDLSKPPSYSGLCGGAGWATPSVPYKTWASAQIMRSGTQGRDVGQPRRSSFHITLIVCGV